MSFSLILAVLAALAFGGAVLFFVAAFRPSLPNLSDLFVALERPLQPTALTSRGRPESATATGSVMERVGRTRLFRNVPGPAIPYSDLDLLGLTADRFVGYQVSAAGVCLMFPALVGAASNTFGLPMSMTLPLMLGVALAIGGWYFPHYAVRQDAKAARERFGRAVTSYIDLVVLERLSGAGVASAVVEASHVARAPLFVRIRETLLRRRLERQPPHVALRQLADSIDLPELRDLADTLTIAARDSPVTEALRAKARTIRNEFLARDVERAGRASQRQTAATTLLLMLFLVFMGAPALMRLLAA